MNAQCQYGVLKLRWRNGLGAAALAQRPPCTTIDSLDQSGESLRHLQSTFTMDL